MTEPRKLRPYQVDEVADMLTDVTEWCEHHRLGLKDWQLRALAGVLRGDMPTVPPVVPRRAYARRAQYNGLVALYYLKQRAGELDD